MHLRPACPRHARLWALVEPRLHAGDLSHDALHVLRVYRHACALAPGAGASADLAGAAALVHDLVHIPKDSPDRPLGGERSAAASGWLLAQAGYSASEVAVIVEAVRACSWSRGVAPTSPEGAVLLDGDRLDAIGAIGVLRNAACAQAMAAASGDGDRRLYDPGDPAGRADRPLDDIRNALDHYEIKLLRLAATLHTEAARAEARRRHAFMEAFLAEVERELSYSES